MALDPSTFEKIWSAAEQVAASTSCTIYDIEFLGAGARRILRVFLDKNIEGGVTLEDCSKVSHGLNEILDVDDVIPGGAYNLEVSSPGLERVLKRPEHFSSVVGQTIMVKTREGLGDLNPEVSPALSKRKQSQGVLVSFIDDILSMNVDSENVKIPLSSVEKANAVFDWEKNFGDESEIEKHSKNKKR